MEVLCDYTGEDEDPVKVLNVTTGAYCDTKVTVSHLSGCPIFSAMTWFRVIFARSYIAGPLLIILGALMAFVGRKFFKYTIGLFGAFLGFGTTLLMFFMISMLEDISSNPLGSSAQTDDALSMTIVKITVSVITGVFLGFILT